MELTILFATLLAKKHLPVPQTVILGRGMVIHRHSSWLHLPSWQVHSGETFLAYGREAGSWWEAAFVPLGRKYHSDDIWWLCPWFLIRAVQQRPITAGCVLL